MEVPTYVKAAMQGYIEGQRSAYALGVAVGTWLREVAQVTMSTDPIAYAAKIDFALRPDSKQEARRNVMQLLEEKK